ncbi:MAG: MFS transporter [Pseudomonadota bacterium]|nr:MFS transporter [Pseudomonadota bacterium]
MNNILAIFGYILFDWAIAPASSIIATFIFPTFFVSSLASMDACQMIHLTSSSHAQCGSLLWGHTATFAALLIAILSPMCGSFADKYNNCKTWIFSCTIITAISCSLLWYAQPGVSWIWLTLACVCINTIAVDIAFVFYNALLPTISTGKNIGRLSGISWAAGYFGSIVALVAILLTLILPEKSWLITNENFANVRVVGPLTGAWLLIFAMPFFLFTPERKARDKRIKRATLRQTLSRAYTIPGLIQYMVARMLISDALTTAFTFGGILASTVHGFSNQEVLLLGIGLNLSAGIGGLLLSNLSLWFDEYMLVIWYTCALLVGGGYITFASTHLHFWIAGLTLSFFIGPVQASTRAVFAKICPKENTAEFFGLYMFSGKATAFLGPAIYTALIYMTGSQKLGMCSIIIILAVAWYLLVTNTQIAEQLKTESNAHADSFDLEPSPAVN